MASLNQLQSRALAAQTTGLRYVDATPVALRIVHTATNAVTSVVTTASTLVLTDADGVTTCTFASDSSTLGKLVDRINATANWKAKLLDGLRSQILTTSSTLVVNAGITASLRAGEWGYDVLLDTTVAFTFPIRLTYDRTATNTRPNGGHRVKLVNFEYVINVGTAAAGKVQIWEWDPTFRTETQVWQALSVQSTTTATSYDFSKAPMTVKEGNDLIVLVTDAASISTASTNYIQALYTRE